MSCAAAGSDQGVWGAADAVVGPSVPLPWSHPSHCHSHEISLQESNRKQRGSGVQLGAGVMETEGLELGVCAEPLGRGPKSLGEWWEQPHSWGDGSKPCGARAPPGGGRGTQCGLPTWENSREIKSPNTSAACESGQ